MLRYKFLNYYILLIVVIVFSLSSNITLAQWKNIGPGGGSDLQSIAVHPINSEIVYVGGDIEGLFKTANGGQSWTNINNNLATGPWTPDVYWTNQILFDKSDASYNTLYLATAMAMFKTTDGGTTWSLSFPSTINSGVDFISVYSVIIDPSDNKIIYAGTDGKGVYKTTSSGTSWSKLNIPLLDSAAVFSMAFDSNKNLYLGTTNGIFKSTDNGNTWIQANNGLTNTAVWNLQAVTIANQTSLFATVITHGTPGNASTFDGGIFKSSNGAVSWQNISGNLPQYQSSDSLFYFYWRFAVNPLNTNTIYIGTSVGSPDEFLAAFENWGIYKTVNGGQSWVKVDNNISLGWMDNTFFDERHALVLAISPSDTNTVYWGRDWMNKTTDGGKTWTQIYTQKVGNAWKGTGFELMMVEGMAFDPANSQRVFVGYDDMGPFRSNDNLNSFIPLDHKMDPYDGYDAGKDIEIDSNGDIYLSRYDGLGSAVSSGYGLGQVWKSSDNGDSWTLISNGLPDGRPDLVFDIKSGTPGNRTLYCASYGNGIYKTTNSGADWNAVNNGLGADAVSVWELFINPNNSNELYAGINSFGAGGGLYKSTNGGNLWTKFSSFPAFDILTIDYDKTNNIIYVGAVDNYDFNSDGGLYKSADGGTTWTKIFNHTRVADVEIDQGNPNLLYAVSQPWYEVWLPNVSPGVYKSTDRGNTWNNITGNLAHTFIDFIKLNPNNTSQLFAGTGGGGLWVRDLITGIEEDNVSFPTKFELYQNYPNPFNPSTVISFQLSTFSNVILKVYDVLGREVATLVNEEKPVGNYKVTFDASKLVSGVYLYRIIAGKFVQTKKMILLK